MEGLVAGSAPLEEASSAPAPEGAASEVTLNKREETDIMPIRSDGEIYFNVTVYKAPDSERWVAESLAPAGDEHEAGRLVELFADTGDGDSPGDAVAMLGATELTEEATELIAHAEDVARDSRTQ